MECFLECFLEGFWTLLIDVYVKIRLAVQSYCLKMMFHIKKNGTCTWHLSSPVWFLVFYFCFKWSLSHEIQDKTQDCSFQGFSGMMIPTKKAFFEWLNNQQIPTSDGFGMLLGLELNAWKCLDVFDGCCSFSSRCGAKVLRWAFAMGFTSSC